MNGKSAPGRSLGPCPICGREMVDGPSVNRHHWVPKSHGGDQASDIHVLCHRMLHPTLSANEHATEYATPTTLR
ncbi:MAG: HNH endonuclease, partial [Rhodospirillaceae bacterium]|nr:HNH endonuclease [Rhodospirillaceae bacterium]